MDLKSIQAVTTVPAITPTDAIALGVASNLSWIWHLVKPGTLEIPKHQSRGNDGNPTYTSCISAKSKMAMTRHRKEQYPPKRSNALDAARIYLL
jgi:hypothetical protein